MRRQLPVLWFLLAVAILSVCAAGQARAERMVRLATLADYYPNCYCEGTPDDQLQETLPPGTDSHSLKGYAWDVVRESYHSQGVTIELYLAPWARVMHFVRKGVVDAGFPAVRTPSRLLEFRYSDTPLVTDGLTLAVRRGSFVDLDSLSTTACRVGVVRGWSCGILDGQRLQVVPSDSMLHNLERLHSGTLDAAFCYEDSCRELLRSTPGLDDIELLPSHETREEYLFGARTEPGGKEALALFEKGFEELRHNGRLRELQKKWGREEPRPQAMRDVNGNPG